MRTFIFIVFALCVASTAQSQLQSWNETPSSIGGPFKNFNVYSSNTALNGSFVNFNNQNNTKGKRYLFDNWATGIVIDADGNKIDSDSFYYNVDKIENNLLVTRDKKAIISVYKTQVNSFSLSDGKSTVTYDRVSYIDPNQLLILVAKNDKYSFYKLPKTKFIKSNYYTNGITESGNQFDEYKDEAVYYIATPADKKFVKVDLKKKSLKPAFANDEAKFNEYFSKNTGDINEDYIIGLVEYMK